MENPQDPIAQLQTDIDGISSLLEQMFAKIVEIENKVARIGKSTAQPTAQATPVTPQPNPTPTPLPKAPSFEESIAEMRRIAGLQ